MYGTRSSSKIINITSPTAHKHIDESNEFTGITKEFLMKTEMKTKEETIIEIEKDVINLQQYIRRNNLEIHGIPDNVRDHELEKKVVEIAKCIDVNITQKDIEACHHLPNKSRSKGPKCTKLLDL